MVEREDVAICIIRNGFLSNITAGKKTNIDSMRKFHNWIKYNLIQNAVELSNKDCLLDLSVGRGGDLNKWKTNGIEYVTGIDIDRDSIFASVQRGDKFDGAIARLKNMRIRKPFVRFYNLSVLDPNVLDKLNFLDRHRNYSIVSCQFAFHYFTENNITLNHTLGLISNKLKPGGIFIATFSNGDYIKNNLKMDNIDFGSLKLKKLNGNAYSFMLNAMNETSGINYFELIDTNREYYANIDNMVNLAKSNGLELIQIKDFYGWYKDYKKSQQFNKLDFQEMLISFLNISIILKKTE